MLPAELLQDPYRHSGGLRSLRKPGIPCKFTEAPCLLCSVSAKSLMTKFAFPLCIGSSCKVLCSFQWVKFPGSSPSDSCQCSMPPAQSSWELFVALHVDKADVNLVLVLDPELNYLLTLSSTFIMPVRNTELLHLSSLTVIDITGIPWKYTFHLISI